MKVRAAAIGVIPARYQSSRLPGKPLALIGGKPLIQHVYERASLARSFDDLIVATDDVRIEKAVQAFGGQAMMTDRSHQTGSDRVAEVAENYDAEIIVNVQGDEPFISPTAIDLAVEKLRETPDAVVGTLVTPCRDEDELISENTAKVVQDATGSALYFSRSPIPFIRDAKDLTALLARSTFYLHIGIYVFRRDFLFQFIQLPQGALEQFEKLEQLRILENGHKIICAQTDYQAFSVDTQQDLEIANAKFKSGE